MLYVAVFIDGYQYNTSGKSLYDAVSQAMDAFASDWWKGPKWTPDTMFEVRAIYTEQRWRVRASRVLEWRTKSR